MFGRSYWGGSWFGPRWWGDGGTGTPIPTGLVIRHQGDVGNSLVGPGSLSYSIRRLPDELRLDFDDGVFKRSPGDPLAPMSYSPTLSIHHAGYAGVSGFSDGHYLVGFHLNGAEEPFSVRPTYVRGGVAEYSTDLSVQGQIPTSPEMVLLWMKHRLIDRGVFLEKQVEIAMTAEGEPIPGQYYGRIIPPDWRLLESDGGGRWDAKMRGRVTVIVHQLADVDLPGTDRNALTTFAGHPGLYRKAREVIDALHQVSARDASCAILTVEPLQCFGIYPPRRYGRDRKFAYLRVPMDVQIQVRLSVDLDAYD